MLVAYTVLIFLAWAAYIDWQKHIIPNYVSIIVLFFGFYLHLTNDTWLLGFTGLAVAGITLIPYLLGSMGAGDVKLFCSLGFVMGPAVSVLLFLVLVILALFLICMWFAKHDTRLHIPLAPFILAGYLVLGGVALAGKVIYS
ncbi:prepilin peptidase [Syntrophomonas curvata]